MPIYSQPLAQCRLVTSARHRQTQLGLQRESDLPNPPVWAVVVAMYHVLLPLSSPPPEMPLPLPLSTWDVADGLDRWF